MAHVSEVSFEPAPLRGSWFDSLPPGRLPRGRFYLIRGCESAEPSPAEPSPLEGLRRGLGRAGGGCSGPCPPSGGPASLGVPGALTPAVPPALVSAGLYGLPRRSGKLKDLSKFDATFFGVHAKQAHTMDPQLRLLLEVAYEAIVDGGGSGAVALRSQRGGRVLGPLLPRGTCRSGTECRRRARAPSVLVGRRGPRAGLVSQLPQGVLGVPCRPSFLTPSGELVLG